MTLANDMWVSREGGGRVEKGMSRDEGRTRGGGRDEGRRGEGEMCVCACLCVCVFVCVGGRV